MKKIGKVFGIVAAVLVVLVIVLFILVKVIVTPERIKAVLLPKAEEALHRQITIGEIDVSLFSGIALHKLAVQEREGTESFISADRVLLRYQFWPLFSRRVVVDEVRLDSPHIRVERLADGTFNFSDLLGRDEAKEAVAPEKEGPPVDLLVSEVIVEGGEVLFLDHKLANGAPYRFQMTGFDFAARDISLVSAFPVEMTAQVNGGSLAASGRIDPQSRSGQVKMEIANLDIAPFTPYFRDKIPGSLNAMKVNMNLTAEGGVKEVTSRGVVQLEQIDLILEKKGGGDPLSLKNASLGLEYAMASNLEAKNATITDTTLTFNGIPVKASGTVQDFSAPQVDLQVVIPDIDLRPALKALPAGLLPPAVAELDPAGVVSAQARLRGPAAEPKALLEQGTVKLGQVAANIGGGRASLDGMLKLGRGAVSSENLVLQMGENRASIDLKATDLFSDIIQVTTALRADRFALDPILKTSAAPASGEAGQTPPPPKTVKTARKPLKPPIHAEGTVQIGQTVYKGMAVQDFFMRYVFDQGLLTVSKLTGRTAGGTFGMEAKADLRQPTPPFNIAFDLKGLQADPVVSAFFPKASQVVFGNLNLQTRLEGAGIDAATIKRTLSGKGSLLLADGQLTGAGFFSNFADFLNLEELRVLRFSEAKGSFTIQDGKLQIDSDINGRDVRMQPQGTVGLEDYALNMALKPLFSPELTKKLHARGSLTRLLVDEQGWGRVPVKVDGTLTAPRFHLDTAAVREQVKEKAEEKVRQQLEKRLEKIIPQPKEGEGSGAAQPGRQELEKTLKGLFGR